MTKAPKRKRVLVSLPPGIVEKLDKLCRVKEKTRTSLIEEAIRNLLSREGML